jgi:peroxidase
MHVCMPASCTTRSYLTETVTCLVYMCTQLGGPSWEVKVGRRDSTTASFSGANNNIPPPTSGLANLTALFAAQGLSQKDMVALSGAYIDLAQSSN